MAQATETLVLPIYCYGKVIKTFKDSLNVLGVMQVLCSEGSHLLLSYWLLGDVGAGICVVELVLENGPQDIS